jgi:hypothetical protein
MNNMLNRKVDMNTQYNFWMLPKDKFHQREDMPYSACNGSLKYAEVYAEHLLWCNADATGLEFKAQNGRKTYIVKRTQPGFCG